MDRQLIEQCVEQICHQGCRSVWSCIEALENGHMLAEAKGLSPAEIQLVVAELKSVMAVYEGSCVAG